MRTTAVPVYPASSPPPVQPVYAKQPPVTPSSEPQTPVGDTPIEGTPIAQAKADDKVPFSANPIIFSTVEHQVRFLELFPPTAPLTLL